MQRTRVKVCGITRLEDAMAAVAAGADALGFVFYSKSPRYLEPTEAQKIISQLPPFVQTVGLVVNATAEELEKIVSVCHIQLLQFHGDETALWCEQQSQKLCIPYIKAIAVKPETLQNDIKSFYNAGASAILLDAYDPQLYGGTGKSFDWSQWPTANFPLILAGGLSCENVSNAIKITHPYAVDVSGGIEALDPNSLLPIKGIKDPSKMRAFIQAVQETDFESAHRP